ncbi:MAG: hypothetical protein J6K53_15435 [Roseburia sp.]|nr:hypothetical protein [Roseburia sp.]
MRAKVFFLSLLAMTMFTSCNYNKTTHEDGNIGESRNEPQQEIQGESEQETQDKETIDHIMQCLYEEVPEIDDWTDYVEKKSGGKAYLYQRCDEGVRDVYRNGAGSEYLGEYYSVYVGEMWEDHSVNWGYFYVSVTFDEVLWENTVWLENEFETYTLEEWRNSRYYPKLDA